LGAELRLLVLANSRKYNGRCIAGIDLDSGSWVRPVSDSEHGEFGADECSIVVQGVRRQVRFLDVIDVKVTSASQGIGHPEDVRTDHAGWRHIQSFSVIEFERIVESHLDDAAELLFNCDASVSLGDAQAGRVEKSLCIIRVVDAVFNLTWRGQLRVGFTHQGQQYDLPVTDEGEWVRAAKNGPEQMSAGPWYFTISLGEPFKGRMWKLIAGGLLSDGA
jgi:hypothetical protein